MNPPRYPLPGRRPNPNVSVFRRIAGGLSLLLTAAWLSGCGKTEAPTPGGATPAVGSSVSKHLGAWGVLVDPVGGVVAEASGNTLTVTVPAGIRDLSGVRIDGGNTAPRVLQEVEGDFVATVKVTGDFNPPRSPTANAFNGAGLLVFAANDHFLRVERNVWTTPDGGQVCYTPLFEYWHKGEMQSEERLGSAMFFKGRSTHLRLERKGSEFIAGVSHNGSDWQVENRVTTQFPAKVSLGVCAINTAGKPLQVEFSDWTLARVK